MNLVVWPQMTFLRILAATTPHQARGIEADVFGVFKLNPIKVNITSGDTAAQN